MIDYTIVRSPRRKKSISVKLSPNREIIVTAPYQLSNQEIAVLLQPNLDLLEKKLSLLPQVKAKDFTHGEEFLYRGQLYPLTLTYNPTLPQSLSFNHQNFLYNLSTTTPLKMTSRSTIKNAFETWYINQARRVLRERVDSLAAQIGQSFQTIRVKRLESIWGSCSQKRNLNFNWKIILAPDEIIDYLVAHEVSHLKHSHHQKDFWTTVASLDPFYQEHNKWLRANSLDLKLWEFSKI